MVSSNEYKNILEWIASVHLSVSNRDGRNLSNLFNLRNFRNTIKGDLCSFYTQDIKLLTQKYFQNKKNLFSGSLSVIIENFLELYKELMKKNCQWANILINGTVILNSWIEIYRDQEAFPCHWVVPVLSSTCILISKIGIMADTMLNSGDLDDDENEDYQNKYQISVLNSIRQQIGKFRGDDDRQAGYVILMTESIKCCMQLRNMQMASTFLKHIESSNINRNRVPKGPMVLFCYFLGKLYMQQDRFVLAEEQLIWAFGNSGKNNQLKRNILECLIPVKFRLGFIPNISLLKKYNLEHYFEISKAILQGNIKRFDAAIEKYSSLFINHGTILCIEKVKFILYRNLMRRIRNWCRKNLKGDPNKLTFSVFDAGFKWQSDELFDQQEMACICANLIKLGYIKGYISWEHQVVVFSVNDPFPKLSNVKP
ncbi:Csn12p/Rpn3p family protein component of the COP9 signalsome [Cryptosporidium hominis]|uniref:Csn12p/Rpn3p family protein component of the COP9 signalsome n=1 Tax=Cryptosporidium hominis TaxID=237895 RepID=A0ABX5BAI6_CRYHO|nr:Csn12p/Rpn3p family protein component of the COP9 signalsome [Cryptosporidium hominis]|eukprot:PPS94107.1 Csn12p/Rpn3p family protein component of the COP9 signalsome [Cryptosporidium hominis]